MPCKGGAQIAVHHFGGEGPSLIVLAANGFVPKVYLPMVKPRQPLLSLSGQKNLLPIVECISGCSPESTLHVLRY